MTLSLNTIRSVVDEARGASDELLAIINGLAPLTTQPYKLRLAFDHEDLQIQIGMPGQFTRLVERLTALEPLKLAVAPVVEALISTNERDLIVVRYWAIPGEQRLAIDAAHAPDEVARARFRCDLLKLADAGWIHQYAMRGGRYRRMGSKTGVVTLEDWVVVVPAEDEPELVAMIRGLS